MKLRVGHGLIIIGLFGILDTLPPLIEAWETHRCFLEARAKGSPREPSDRS